MQVKSEVPGGKTVQSQQTPPGEPLLDMAPYGSGKDDSVSDVTENSAITQYALVTNGTSIPYTARAGHLFATDPYSARLAAKIFYVAFTVNGVTASRRSITFLQWRPWLVVGLLATWIIWATKNQD